MNTTSPAKKQVIFPNLNHEAGSNIGYENSNIPSHEFYENLFKKDKERVTREDVKIALLLNDQDYEIIKNVMTAAMKSKGI